MTRPGKRLRIGVVLAVAASGAVGFLPGCRWSSCEDDRTCPLEGGTSEGDESDNRGGAGGAGGAGSDVDTSTSNEGGAGPGDGAACTSGEVLCDDSCIQPETDPDFCGATGSCQGDDAGTACGSDEHCVSGVCEFDCGAGLLYCEETCVDPLSDDDHCGADDCSSGATCSSSEQCVDGACRSWGDGRIVFVSPGDVEYAPDVQIDGDGEVVVASMREAESGGELLTSRYLPQLDVWSAPAIQEETSSLAWYQFEMNEAGRGVLAWSDLLETTRSLVPHGALRHPTGDWTAPVTLPHETPPDSETTTPAVCLDEAGNGFAVWRESSVPPRLYAAGLAAGEDSWRGWGEVAVSAETLEPYSSDVVCLGGGRALLFFMNQEDQMLQLYASVGAISDGFAAVEAVASMDPTLYAVDVLAVGGESGVAAIAWEDGLDFPKAFVYRDGEWSDRTTLENPDGESSQLEGAVIDDAGELTFFTRTSAPASTLWASSYDHESESVGEAQRAVGPVDQIVNPAFAVDGFGNIQAVWAQDALGVRSLWGARWSTTRGEWGSPGLLEESDVPVEEFAVDFNQAGQGMVVWWAQTDRGEELGYNYFD